MCYVAGIACSDVYIVTNTQCLNDVHFIIIILEPDH